MFFQNAPKRVHGACVGTDRSHITSFCLLQRAAYHLMGNGIRKQNEQIRRADILQAICHFRIYLYLTLVLSAQIFILAGHAFIAADNYYTHVTSPLQDG